MYHQRSFCKMISDSIVNLLGSGLAFSNDSGILIPRMSTARRIAILFLLIPFSL